MKTQALRLVLNVAIDAGIEEGGRNSSAGSWRTFLSQFNVVRLGYDGIDIDTVMDWYDESRAPFREGKKRKEFPDAFAVAILEKYARDNYTVIAVVSSDPDFNAACARYSIFLRFRA